MRNMGRWTAGAAALLACVAALAQSPPDADTLAARVAALEAGAPESAELAGALNDLATVLRDAGRYREAEPLFRRSIALFGKVRGPEDADLATAIDNLGALYLEEGRYAEAEALQKQALAMREKVLGPDHADVSESLNNLASLYYEQGRYAEAEPLHQRSLGISRKVHGPEHPDVATSLNNLAMVYLELGRYDDAEPLYRSSLAMREKLLGPDHPSVATSLNNLGSLHQALGRYREAEPLLLRCLAIREKALGPEHRAVAASLNNLAALYQEQGRFGDAEPYYLRSLALREKALGPEHPEVAITLNNLAGFYQAQARIADAEPLYRRGLAIWEKANGPDHPELASFLNNLGTLYRDSGRYAEAEAPFARALALREKSLGPEHAAVATSLTNLATLYRALGRPAEARPLYERSVAIRAKALGVAHPDYALSLGYLGALAQSQGRHDEADALLVQSFAIAEGALGADHPQSGRALNDLAGLRHAQGRTADGLALARRASAVFRGRILAATDDNSPREASVNRAGFHRHVTLLLADRAVPREQAVAESFAIAQLAEATATGAAVARMAARFSRGSDALATLVKARQDRVERARAAERELLRAAGEPAAKRDRATEQRQRELLAGLHGELAANDAELERRFPQYRVLTSPEPLAVREVQALLRADEALVFHAVGTEGAWCWVVRRDRAHALALDAKEKDLADAINSVRARVNPQVGRMLPLRLGELHDLYRRVFAPAAAHLAGVRHVLLVPTGPLQSLPFGMLVTSPPKSIGAPADYRGVDWLAKRHAFSVLPSVASLRALRRFATGGTGKEPFAGFGDPDLTRAPDPLRGQDLPETADELRAIAKALAAREGSLWLRAAATETNVKHTDLSRYRVLAFATHGLMAGELGFARDAGLVLTPPDKPSAEDDGFLSATEIAQLKLNADWVLLSACNTAAPDGTPGAEGLSGLGKAFFYAGSRSMLVTHWPIASEATVLLTTRMMREYAGNPRGGKAAALRRAMLALMADTRHPEFAHPFYWAPFILVGEGGGR